MNTATALWQSGERTVTSQFPAVATSQECRGDILVHSGRVRLRSGVLLGHPRLEEGMALLNRGANTFND
jgi:hypothetical protein